MDITVKGWLKKQPVQRATGGGGSALKRKVGRAKRRYFVLFQGQEVSNLVYFTNEKCVKEKGRLVVGSGSTVQARLDGSHSFELVDRDGNVFVAQADTSSDASVWVRVIQQAISQHRGTSGAGSAATGAAAGAAVSTAARAAGPGSASASAAASSSSSSSSSSAAAAAPAPTSASAGGGVSSAVVLGPAASGPNGGGGGGGRGVADAGLEPGSEEWVAQLRETEAGHQKELLHIRQQTADVAFHDRGLDDHGGSSDEDGDDELLDPKTIQALALKVKLELELDQARAQLAKHGHEPIEYRDDSLDVQDQQDGGATEIGAAAAHTAPLPAAAATGTPGNRHTVGSVPIDAAATAPAPEQQPTALGREEHGTDRAAAGNGHADAGHAAGADDAAGADHAAKAQWLRTQEQLARLQSGDARAPAVAASASASLGSAPAAAAAAAAARDPQRPSGARPPAGAAAAAPGNEDSHALRLENLRLQDEIKRLKQSHAETMAAARARERELAARVTTLEQQLTNLRLGGGPAEDKAVDSNCKCTVA